MMYLGNNTFLNWILRSLGIVFFLVIQSIDLKAKQDSFVKYLLEPDNSQRLRVIPSGNNSWFLVSLDSSEIHKFSPCGKLEWTSKLSYPSISWRGVDVIPITGGGLALLGMNYPTSKYYGMVVILNNNGAIVWSKAIDDSLYSEVPYSVIQDKQGDYFIKPYPKK